MKLKIILYITLFSISASVLAQEADTVLVPKTDKPERDAFGSPWLIDNPTGMIRLLDGAPEIKLRGKFVNVNASVINVEGLSAHADQTELIQWMSSLSKPPKYILITHGEPASAQALQEKIRQVYNWETGIPHLNQVIDL